MNADAQLSVTAPTRVQYVLDADGTFICPDDAKVENNSAVPAAVKSWTADVKAGSAVSQGDFGSTSAKHAWWIDVAADGGAASAYNQDAGELFDSWNMAASGMSLEAGNDDTLDLEFSGAMKNMDGSLDVNAGKQLASVAMAFGTVLNGQQPPQPDPVNGTMFAVYSDSDSSLDFYKRDRVPAVGDTFNGKNVTAVYEGGGE